MLSEITNSQSAAFERLTERADFTSDAAFRASYLAHHLRAFLADQIRVLRGELSQREFRELIGKPQSVISRLEDEEYGKVTLQTLIDIATKLDIGLLVRFVDFPKFLERLMTFLRIRSPRLLTIERPLIRCCSWRSNGKTCR